MAVGQRAGGEIHRPGRVVQPRAGLTRPVVVLRVSRDGRPPVVERRDVLVARVENAIDRPVHRVQIAVHVPRRDIAFTKLPELIAGKGLMRIRRHGGARDREQRHA